MLETAEESSLRLERHALARVAHLDVHPDVSSGTLLRRLVVLDSRRRGRRRRSEPARLAFTLIRSGEREVDLDLDELDFGRLRELKNRKTSAERTETLS